MHFKIYTITWILFVPFSTGEDLVPESSVQDEETATAPGEHHADLSQESRR